MAPPVVRRAPYKDFLQPALHRRFTSTALILLAVAYIEAVLLPAKTSWLWAWFPLGPAGLRTIFYFLCSVAVILLRIAQYHVGLRTSTSSFQTLREHLFKIQTLEAIVSYTLSANLYSFVYLLSVPESANLSWITYFSGHRSRLNERPLLFVGYFVALGLTQALLHVYRDTDRLSLGVVARTADASKQPGDATTQLQRFYTSLPGLIPPALIQACMVFSVYFVLYLALFRGAAWQTALLVFRPFYSLPKTNVVPAHWPISIYLLCRCLAVGFVLCLVWAAANQAFSIFLVKEPLKKGLPLTSESKDPNGSLLNGLKSKKTAIKCFAMWELALIARDFEVRRRAVYEDIDRHDGPMWSQVYAICIDQVKSIERRIDTFKNPPKPAAPATATAVDPNLQKLGPAPSDKPILKSTPTKKSFRTEVESTVGGVALAPGQSSWLVSYVKDQVAEGSKQARGMIKEQTGQDNLTTLFRQQALRVLKTPLGIPFRQEYSRRLTSIVLGTPYGEPSLYINAITALTILAVHSLAEDKYGNVQRDVPTIIRTFTTATRQLEAFTEQLPVHWTDVGGKQSSPEVDAIAAALKDGLSQLVQDFGPYSRDLRLSLTDMRLAREAVGKQQEMKKIES